MTTTDAQLSYRTSKTTKNIVMKYLDDFTDWKNPYEGTYRILLAAVGLLSIAIVLTVLIAILF